MTCEARHCGTSKGYSFYGCRCPEAGRAERRYRKRLAAGIQPPGIIDGTGTRRRVQALLAMGWPLYEIAARLGWGPKSHPSRLVRVESVQRRLAERVARIYDELSMTVGPSNGPSSQTTASKARKAGYLPPLAWDDDTIDDPNAQPLTGEPVVVDEVAVRRALDGHAPEGLRPAERNAAILQAHRAGWSDPQIAERLGMNTTAVQHQRVRLLRRAAVPSVTALSDVSGLSDISIPRQREGQAPMSA